MPRIYLCDDAPDYRRLIREVLSAEPDIEVVGEGGNGSECVHAVADHHPDVILLDLQMPVMDGFQALPRLRETSPETQVLILSTAPPEEVEERAVELGAVGYLQKPVDIFTLPGAMREKVTALDRRTTPRAA